MAPSRFAFEARLSAFLFCQQPRRASKSTSWGNGFPKFKLELVSLRVPVSFNRVRASVEPTSLPPFVPAFPPPLLSNPPHPSPSNPDLQPLLTRTTSIVLEVDGECKSRIVLRPWSLVARGRDSRRASFSSVFFAESSTLASSLYLLWIRVSRL